MVRLYKAGPCGGNSPNYSSDGVSIKNVNVCTLKKKKKKIKYKFAEVYLCVFK